MNWGLFATLAGFLLPVALAMRVGFNLVWAQQSLMRPAQACRVVQLLLLCIPITGKAAAVTYAVTGKYGDIAQLSFDFMITPWGCTHLAMTIAAVIACDVFAPRIIAQLEQPPFSAATPTRAYLARDVGIIVLLLAIAWMGAH